MKTRLQQTTNYSQFRFAEENRDVDVKHLRTEHKRLRESMRRYGFLPSCPITVRAVNGRFEILEGQHRFTFARELRLPVWFVVLDASIDIAEINQTQATWRVIDYAKRWAKAGRDDYSEVMTFAEKWHLPLSLAFCILGGTTTFSNISNKFRSGDYRVKSRAFGTRVAKIYDGIRECVGTDAKRPLLQAIVAACYVPYFDESRVLDTLAQNPDLFGKPTTRDGCLETLGELYNFRRRTREPLAFDARQAMRSRNVLNMPGKSRKGSAKVSRRQTAKVSRRVAA